MGNVGEVSENGQIEGRAYCKRIKKNGDPCKNAPMKGQQICHKHGGKAPQNLRKAAERISAAAPGAVARIEHLSKYAEKEELRLKANQDLLDRAGIGAKDSLDVNINVPMWKEALGEIFVEYNPDVIDGEVADEYENANYPTSKAKTPIGERPTPFPTAKHKPPRYTPPAP